MMTIDFIFKSHGFSISALVKWILSACSNIHDLEIELPYQESFLDEIGRLKKLKKLKKLNVTAYYSSDLKEVTLIASIIMPTLLTSWQIVRSCRQVEILKMNIWCLTLWDVTKLEPAENTTDFTLFWENHPAIEEVLSVLKRLLKRWQQLHQLTLWNTFNKSVPQLELLGDFIMEMKHLSYLHIAPHFDDPNGGQLEILRDQVNELILPLCPNFKFDIFRIGSKFENEFM